MRGNPTGGRWNGAGPRSIPACAGEPSSGRADGSGCAVYPRVCGGTGEDVGHVRAHVGLSPRVRGNLGCSNPSASGTGSIPACAGEPPKATFGHGIHRVYPRVCGGTALSGNLISIHDGLSPRVRGNPAAATRPANPRRSIPACAGEPHTEGKPLCVWKVYPRVCGGTSSVRNSANRMSGLSPRVRGNPGTAISASSAGGSIPACAGGTRRRGG